MIFFRLQSWIFSLSWGKNRQKHELVINFLWRFGSSNDIITPVVLSFASPLSAVLSSASLLFFLHLSSLSPLRKKLSLHAPTIYMPPAPSFLHSCCSFWNLWISLHHFLDFFFLFHAPGRYSHSSPSLFSPHFLPPERLCQTGCKVTVWPVEVRVVCV